MKALVDTLPFFIVNVKEAEGANVSVSLKMGKQGNSSFSPL